MMLQQECFNGHKLYVCSLCVYILQAQAPAGSVTQTLASLYHTA